MTRSSQHLQKTARYPNAKSTQHIVQVPSPVQNWTDQEAELQICAKLDSFLDRAIGTHALLYTRTWKFLEQCL